MKADPGKEVPHLEAGVVERRGEEQWQYELGAGKGGGTKDRVDLAADAAAVDQHQPGDEIRKLVRELHGDPATERVPDHRDLGNFEGDEQVAHPAGVGTERVIALWLGGAAVTEQVGGDHRVPRSQVRHDRFPGA